MESVCHVLRKVLPHPLLRWLDWVWGFHHSPYNSRVHPLIPSGALCLHKSIWHWHPPGPGQEPGLGGTSSTLCSGSLFSSLPPGAGGAGGKGGFLRRLTSCFGFSQVLSCRLPTAAAIFTHSCSWGKDCFTAGCFPGGQEPLE